VGLREEQDTLLQVQGTGLDTSALYVNEKIKRTDTIRYIHCEKNLFVLAFHLKIPLLRIGNPVVYNRTFFPATHRSFSHSPHHVRKLFGSLEGDLLHSQMPIKSFGSWNKTFYIPHAIKV
jgi:hypothetical protein